MQIRLYIDEAHTALDIFRFAVFFSEVQFFFLIKASLSCAFYTILKLLWTVVILDRCYPRELPWEDVALDSCYHVQLFPWTVVKN